MVQGRGRCGTVDTKFSIATMSMPAKAPVSYLSFQYMCQLGSGFGHGGSVFGHLAICYEVPVAKAGHHDAIKDQKVHQEAWHQPSS